MLAEIITHAVKIQVFQLTRNYNQPDSHHRSPIGLANIKTSLSLAFCPPPRSACEPKEVITGREVTEQAKIIIKSTVCLIPETFGCLLIGDAPPLVFFYGAEMIKSMTLQSKATNATVFMDCSPADMPLTSSTGTYWVVKNNRYRAIQYFNIWCRQQSERWVV